MASSESATVSSRRSVTTWTARSASVRANRVSRSVRYCAAGGSSRARSLKACRVTRSKKRGSNPDSTWCTVTKFGAGRLRLDQSSPAGSRAPVLVSRAMRSESADTLTPIMRRGLLSSRPRRPWLLIVASLLLAFLSTVLWAKWEQSRARAERLQAEIKQVYAEAEALRTQAARAQQRVIQLERQLRDGAEPDRTPSAKPKGTRAR